MTRKPLFQALQKDWQRAKNDTLLLTRISCRIVLLQAASCIISMLPHPLRSLL